MALPIVHIYLSIFVELQRHDTSQKFSLGTSIYQSIALKQRSALYRTIGAEVPLQTVQKATYPFQQLEVFKSALALFAVYEYGYNEPAQPLPDFVDR